MTVIITLFVLYTIGCCLDGPDLKPKWRKWLGMELHFLSESLYHIPNYDLPQQPLNIEVTDFDARKVVSSMLINEHEMLMNLHIFNESDVNNVMERMLCDARRACERQLADTIISNNLITCEVDRDSAYPNVIVRTWLYVGIRR